MHHGSSQKHSSGELGPQNQEPLVPFQHIGRHPGHERGQKDHDQTPHLRQDQSPRVEVNGNVVGVWFTVAALVVVVAAMGAYEGEKKGEREEEEEYA